MEAGVGLVAPAADAVSGHRPRQHRDGRSCSAPRHNRAGSTTGWGRRVRPRAPKRLRHSDRRGWPGTVGRCDSADRPGSSARARHSPADPGRANSQPRCGEHSGGGEIRSADLGRPGCALDRTPAGAGAAGPPDRPYRGREGRPGGEGTGGQVRTILALVRMGKPPRARVALSVALGALTILAGVGLMALAGYLISRSAEHPPVLSLTVAIVAVRALGIGRPIARYFERLESHDLAF